MKTYVADFETLVHDTHTYVWGYGVCEIGNVDNIQMSNNIDHFIEWCATGDNKLIYFHNLKFDGEFIIYWLLKNGFTYSEKKREKTFNCIISNTGQFYSIEITFKKYQKKYKKVTFHDSLKKLPFQAEKIAKAFKLPMLKGDIDYKLYRTRDHQLTNEEKEYIKNDIQIIALALEIQFKEGLDRMTVGSDALHQFKLTVGEDNFKRWFPVMPKEIDDDFRQAYRGGFTYVSDRFKEKDIGKGMSYDVNSLYPSVMYEKSLPYDTPIFFKGRYKDDSMYPLYLQRLVCTFKLKKDKIPTIQLKDNDFFPSTEYIKDSGFEEVPMVLTNVDLDLFFEHYDVNVIEWLDGWKFKATTGLFDDYIDYWMKVKEENAEEKNALYTLAKLMLNSLYGKFATNPDVTGKYPYLEDNRVKYTLKEEEYRDPVYTPMGVFITSYAREKTIRTAQTVYPRFIYADTDSIHITGVKEPNIDIHPSRLGAWKHEGNFTRGRFLRAKAYIEEIEGKLLVKCAGMPDNVKKEVTWDNFHIGFRSDEKLRPHHLPGGIVLKPSPFKITPKGRGFHG